MSAAIIWSAMCTAVFIGLMDAHRKVGRFHGIQIVWDVVAALAWPVVIAILVENWALTGDED